MKQRNLSIRMISWMKQIRKIQKTIKVYKHIKKAPRGAFFVVRFSMNKPPAMLVVEK